MLESALGSRLLAIAPVVRALRERDVVVVHVHAPAVLADGEAVDRRALLGREHVLHPGSGSGSGEG